MVTLPFGAGGKPDQGYALLLPFDARLEIGL
jgi:hypothetical protein